jgi:hypothetical protein
MKFDKEYNQLKVDCIHKTLLGDIYKSLGQINTTCPTYIDEEAANRELCTCLKLLGHNSIYDYRGLGRQIDIFADSSIIEGKLEPNTAELDRLIGQITDFLTTPCHIYIVCYGLTEQRALDRIKTQIVNLHPNKVNLVYLLNPQRCRKPSTAEDLSYLNGQYIKGLD